MSCMIPVMAKFQAPAQTLVLRDSGCSLSVCQYSVMLGVGARYSPYVLSCPSSMLHRLLRAFYYSLDISLTITDMYLALIVA